MARLPITANIFDKKILPKVAKLVVAADSENSKQNRTVSTFQKSKVVNLRFFFFFFFFFQIFVVIILIKNWTLFHPPRSYFASSEFYIFQHFTFFRRNVDSNLTKVFNTCHPYIRGKPSSACRGVIFSKFCAIDSFYVKLTLLTLNWRF